MIEILAQVTGVDMYGKPFAAGVVLWDDVVVEAAPILKRALMGKSRDYVRAYCHRVGHAVEVVHQLTRSRAGLGPAPGGRAGSASRA